MKYPEQRPRLRLLASLAGLLHNRAGAGAQNMLTTVGDPGPTTRRGPRSIGAEQQTEWIRYRLTGEKLKAFAAG